MLDTLLHSIAAAVFQPTAVSQSTPAVIAVAVAVAALLVIPRGVWTYSGLVVTVIHELGHGFAGLLTGRRVVGIRISADHAGLTTSKGTRASAPFSTFFGYPAPAIYGACLVIAAIFGRGGTALGVSLAILLISLVFMRGALTCATVVVTLLAGLAVLAWCPGEWLTGIIGGIGVYVLIGSLRGFSNVLRAHLRGRTGDSDAALLGQTTGVPAVIWLFFMAVVIAGSFAAAGWAVSTIL